ncbi:MAG: 4Fe-4S ferredoxin, partial [Bacillota bacterium]
VHEGGCPGSRMLMMEQKNEQQSQTTSDIPSQLKQWPVQIHLLSPQAPYLENSDLLVTADCVPVAYGNFQKLLKDKTVALGCPKLDDGGQYVNKLAQIFQHNNINSVTVVRMEVPCCGGLVQIVNQALKQAESSLDVEVINISIAGDIL